MLMAPILLLSFAMTPFAFVPRIIGPQLMRSGPYRSFGKRMRRRPAVAGSHEGPVRVRFAPSPTGSLHIGGARTALFNWLKARNSKGTYVLRIEDTDLKRSTKESEASMIADLDWLGLHWDEGPGVEGSCGPYRQSERNEIYASMAQKLLDNGAAYRCFETESEHEAKREEALVDSTGFDYSNEWRNADPEVVAEKMKNGEPFTVKFKVMPGSGVSIQDTVRGKVNWDAESTLSSDFVLLRSSGVPVYNFCVAVDDALMGISHVIRAEEHLTNTLRQGLILKALGYKLPQYAHASLILGEDRSKLSKRHGATSILQFKQQGFLKDAMLNYLATLGWNDGTEKEIYTADELVEAFQLDRIVKAPSMFDMTKLRWINAQHMRKMDCKDLMQQLKPFLLESGLLIHQEMDDKFLEIAVNNSCRKVEVLCDAIPIIRSSLQYPLLDTLGSEAVGEAHEMVEDGLKEVVEEVLRAWEEGRLPSGAIRATDQVAEFETQWKGFVKEIGKTLGRKGKRLFHPLRLALTGAISGPDVGDQLLLVAAAEGQVKPDCYIPLPKRMETLKQWLSTHKNIAK